MLELNSAAPRSGAALKRAIQETTLSHSSLAAVAKGRKDDEGKRERVEDGLIGQAMAVKDEDEKDSGGSYGFGGRESESESEKELVRESHALTVILIDEGECTCAFLVSIQPPRMLCHPIYCCWPLPLYFLCS